MMKNDKGKPSPSPSSSPLHEPLTHPLALRPDLIAPERTLLVVTMHRSWLGGDFTVRRRAHAPDDGTTPTTILTSTGKWTSLHPRTEFHDASGRPLFTLKMSWWSFSNAWYLELPRDRDRDSDSGPRREGGGGQRILTVRYKTTWTRAWLEVVLNNAASAAREEVTLLVQAEEEGAEVDSSVVLWQGRPVAVIRKTADVSMSKVMMEFEAEVAAGMDQAIVCIVRLRMTCRECLLIHFFPSSNRHL